MHTFGLSNTSFLIQLIFQDFWFCNLLIFLNTSLIFVFMFSIYQMAKLCCCWANICYSLNCWSRTIFLGYQFTISESKELLVFWLFVLQSRNNITSSGIFPLLRTLMANKFCCMGWKKLPRMLYILKRWIGNVVLSWNDERHK